MTESALGRVTVVVLTWNNRKIIEECLMSLRELDWPDVEIVVVDNGSTDGCRQFLEEQPDVRLVALPANTGFAGGQVAAWPHVTGELVALVNSDAVVARDWLQRLVPEMDDLAVAAAGGKAYQWLAAGDIGRTDVPYAAYQTVDLRSGYTTTIEEADVATDVDAIGAAAVLLRKSAVDAVGGFDHRFFAYYEETDLLARMIRTGLRVRYVPDAHAWHQLRASSASSEEFYAFYMRRNMALFFLRNFDARDCRVALWAYARGLAASVRRHDRGSRVAVRAACSLVAVLPHVLITRRQIRRLGGTYGRLLPSVRQGEGA